MQTVQINLAGFGPPSAILDSLAHCDVEVIRAGEIWNQRTKRRYPENIIRICESLCEQDSVETAVERLRQRWSAAPSLQLALSQCGCVELQVWISMGETHNQPNIHLSAKQIAWMCDCRARLDVSVS